jgi:thiol-disulfide isomerase/thioredoxin
MNRRQLAIISVIVLAVIVIGGILYVVFRPSGQLNNASTAPVNAAAQLGQKAPDFTTASTHGLFTLSTAGKPVLLEIFASWCPHCQRETAVLNKLYETFGSRVAFISIPGSDTGMDGASPESTLDVLEFQKRFNVQYPIGAYDPNLAVAKLYLKGGYPTIAIIDRNGTITYINSGEVSYDELAAALEKVLK